MQKLLSGRRELIVGAAASLALPHWAFAQSSRIKIGQSAPLSGANAAFGKDIRDGALAAFKRVNDAGGLAGALLELETLDDGNKAEQSAANAAQLEKNGALALFGFASATLALPALKVMNQARLSLWSPFSGADAVRKSGKYMISTRASYEEEINKLINLWASGGFKRFGVLFYDDAVGVQNYQSVTRALSSLKVQPLEVRIKRNAPVDAESFNALLKNPPEALIMTTLADAGAQIVKGLVARGKGGLIQISSTSFAGNSQLLDALGGDGDGVSMTAVVPSFERRSLVLAAEYQADLAKLKPDLRPSYASFESYIAARALAELMRSMGKKPVREDIADAAARLRQVNIGGYNLKTDGTQNYVDTVVISNGRLKT